MFSNRNESGFRSSIIFKTILSSLVLSNAYTMEKEAPQEKPFIGETLWKTANII